MFLVGFDGMTLTNELQELIESHYVGAILLTAKNVHCEHTDPILRTYEYLAYQIRLQPQHRRAI